MEHLLLKAAVTAADQGSFEAVISAASVDRERDIVDPAGMVRALHKWIPTGKKIPLAWNHSTKAEDQIGFIDPSTARVVGSEVVATGWIDQSSEVGAHAWRQVKAGTLGFSFGYLTLASSPRKGGGRLLKEIDVFEVTATATPMNNDTRVLAWKAAVEVEEEEQDTLEAVSEMLQDFLDTEDDDQDIATARDILARVQALIVTEQAEVPEKSLSELRAETDRLALEHATGGATLPESTPDPVEEPDPEPKSLADLFTPDEIDAMVAADAKARIPKSQFSPSVKEELAVKAQQILDEQKKAEVTDKEPSRARSVDPLRAKADAVALELASAGESLKQPPRPAKKAPPPDLVPLEELKQRMRDEMLTALSGMDIEHEQV